MYAGVEWRNPPGCNNPCCILAARNSPSPQTSPRNPPCHTTPWHQCNSYTMVSCTCSKWEVQRECKLLAARLPTIRDISFSLYFICMTIVMKLPSIYFLSFCCRLFILSNHNRELLCLLLWEQRQRYMTHPNQKPYYRDHHQPFSDAYPSFCRKELLLDRYHIYIP